MKINRQELVTLISKNSNLTKRDTNIFLDAFTKVIGDELAKGNKINLFGFGMFEVKERAARTACNPRTGEPIKVDSYKIPVFKVGNLLKKTIRKNQTD